VIILKSAAEIEKMRQAGKITAMVLEKVAKEVKPGIKTRQLDTVAAEEVSRLGAKPSFKGYRGYPACLCVSINDEIVHGIPGDRVIREGDIVSIDFGAIYDGFQGDSAVTVAAGSTSIEAHHLMDTTREALEAGISAARAGNRLGDISAAVQGAAESAGFNVVREYTGHGIGRDMHEDPLVPNFGLAGEGIKLEQGMTLALEPMVNTGTWRTRTLKNRWTVVTADGGLSAHYEHTIVIRDGEAEVLTRP
jgi:methionyl aminopeptidase